MTSLPAPRQGLTIDATKSWTRNALTLGGWLSTMRDLTGETMDEVALLGDENLATYLRKEGWEEFNSAEDDVATEPWGTRYHVRYRFFRHSDHSYRLEVMRLLSGFSPLHAALWDQNAGGLWVPVVHFSYKVQPQDAEAPPSHFPLRSAYLLEGLRLRTDGWVVVQRCVSTYGMFSYWRHPSHGGTQVYCKPRINLRDAAEPGMETLELSKRVEHLSRAAWGE